MNSNTKLSPLLVEAKDQYIRQLAEILAPFVIHSINGAYQFSKKTAKYGQATIDFQKKLKEVPQWNTNTIHQQVSAITSKYHFLSDLIAACFVSYVKILSSVKIHANKPNIRLKLPADDVFVHRVYALAAKDFYTTPALIKADRATRLEIVRNAVETSVRDLLPIHDILKAYLGNTVDDDGVNPDEIDADEFEMSPESPRESPVASSAGSPEMNMGLQSGTGQEQTMAQLQQMLQQAQTAPPPQFAPPQLQPQFAPSPGLPPQFASSPAPPQFAQGQAVSPSTKIIGASPAKSIRVPLGNPGAFVTPLGFDDAGHDDFFK